MKYLPRKYRSILQVFILLAILVASKEYELPIDFEYILGVIGTILAGIFSFNFLKKRSYKEGSFAKNPKDFNREFIEIEGKIVKIFGDTLAERLKRKAVDKWRDSTGDPNPKGRYIHQRFLIKSKDMYPGETLLIEHNENFGRINITRGDKIAVKGEYIHTSNPSRHRYGRLHKTHRPSGWIKVI